MPQCQREEALLKQAQDELDNNQDANPGRIQVLIEHVRQRERELEVCLNPPPQLPAHQDPVPYPPDHRTGIVSPLPIPPCAVAFPSNEAAHKIVLMAVTENGFATSFWDDSANDSNVGEWSEWIDSPNTTGIVIQQWRPEMALLGWINPVDHHTRVNGFIALGDVDDNVPLATPWWDLPGNQNLTLDTMVPPRSPIFGNDFLPLTGATWRDELGRSRLNIFGAVVNSQLRTRRIRELFWDGDWHWTDHESGEDITLGPGSVSMDEAQGFLFGLGSNVQLRYWNPGQEPEWQWHDLGRPDDVLQMRSPLAVRRVNPATGRTEVSVFIAGGHRPSQTWRLYERHWNGEDIDDWDEWADHGAPQRIVIPTNTTGSATPDDPDQNGFQMTSAVVWNDEQGKLRLNIFGYTDAFDDTAQPNFRQGGQLIEFWHDGENWMWGSLADNEAYSGELQFPSEVVGIPVPVKISSAVITRGVATRVHISVFGISESGALWERFFDSWTTPNWRWMKH